MFLYTGSLGFNRGLFLCVAGLKNILPMKTLPQGCQNVCPTRRVGPDTCFCQSFDRNTIAFALRQQSRVSAGRAGACRAYKVHYIQPFKGEKMCPPPVLSYPKMRMKSLKAAAQAPRGQAGAVWLSCVPPGPRVKGAGPLPTP